MDSGQKRETPLTQGKGKWERGKVREKGLAAVDRGQWTVISEQKESCIVKKDCSKSENMVKYFQESERDEKANELHKGV